MSTNKNAALNEIGNQLIETIKAGIFPNNAEFTILPIHGNGDFTCEIDWKLPSNPQRPNKRSSTIKILISREALEQCEHTCDYTNKFITAIKTKFETFTPDHTKSGNDLPPVVTWNITSADI